MFRRKVWREGFSTLIFKPEPIITPTEEVYQKSILPKLEKSKIIYVGVGLIIILGVSSFFIPYLGNVLGALAFSIMPAAIFFVWVMKTDKYEPEPKSLILAVMGLGGGISAIFSMIMFPKGLIYYLSKIVLIEIIFFLILIGLDSNRITGRELNDHLDGAIYGLSLGLGYVLYGNLVKTFLMPSLINPLMLVSVAVESLFVSVFPALTGWWIGYVKAKYTSVNITDLLAGFIPICITRILYEAIVIMVAPLNIALRLTLVILAGLLILYVLVRRVRWALEDEKIWGYSVGLAPLESGVSK